MGWEEKEASTVVVGGGYNSAIYWTLSKVCTLYGEIESKWMVYGRFQIG